MEKVDDEGKIIGFSILPLVDLVTDHSPTAVVLHRQSFHRH